jgi:hypothetical protein
VRVSILSELFQGCGDDLEGFIPGNGFPTAFASFTIPFQRSSNAVRIIKTLEACNPFRAEGSSIHWMKRVSGDIDCPPIDDPGQDSTTAHALTADAGYPLFDARGIRLPFNRELGPLPETAP